SYSLSIDDEFAAFRTDNGIWVAQGRWATYLVNQYIIPQQVVPFFPHALFCLCASLACVFCLRAHDLALDLKSILLFPMFAAFPTWYFVAEFYSNLPSVAFGLVLCCMAAMSFRHLADLTTKEPIRAASLLRALVLQAALIGTAMATYQSY